MGLDITACEHAQLVTETHERERGEEPPCYESIEYGGLGHRTAWVDEGFRHALGGLIEGACYTTSGETISFRAGSYSGYNAWRDALCRAANGVVASFVWSDVERWRDAPFFHLINFSDCEGTIGPAVCARLAEQFREQREFVRPKLEPGYWAELYDRWQRAFELAAVDGMVVFH